MVQDNFCTPMHKNPQVLSFSLIFYQKNKFNKLTKEFFSSGFGAKICQQISHIRYNQLKGILISCMENYQFIFTILYLYLYLYLFQNLLDLEGEGCTLQEISQQKEIIIERDKTIEKIQVSKLYKRGYPQRMSL